MKKAIFFAALFLSAISYAQGTYRVSCHVQDSLSEPSQKFEGVLSSQDIKPVGLASANKTEIQVSATYHDSAAAGPFDLIAFNITKAGKTQTIRTGVLSSSGIVSITETVSGQNPSLIGCEFHKN